MALNSWIASTLTVLINAPLPIPLPVALPAARPFSVPADLSLAAPLFSPNVISTPSSSRLFPKPDEPLNSIPPRWPVAVSGLEVHAGLQADELRKITAV